MDEIELKPCPFCGGKQVSICDAFSGNKYARCQSCNACSSVGYTKIEAAANWNTRVPTEPITINFSGGPPTIIEFSGGPPTMVDYAMHKQVLDELERVKRDRDIFMEECQIFEETICKLGRAIQQRGK